jgi:CRISPR/Cas system CSM-associated protein Csm2 small subunit
MCNQKDIKPEILEIMEKILVETDNDVTFDNFEEFKKHMDSL